MMKSILCLLLVLHNVFGTLAVPEARTIFEMKTGIQLRMHVVAHDDSEAMQQLKLTVRDIKADALKEVTVDGLFVAVGTQPRSDLVKGQLELDGAGYVAAGEDTVTSVPGVFVAGDLRRKPLKQVITAAADGAVAASRAIQFVLER